MASLVLAPGEKDPRKIADVVRQLAEGRTNAVGTVTLNANATSTTVSAPTLGAKSYVLLFPLTQHGAWSMATNYVATADITAGQFIIRHASNAFLDRSFVWLAFG